MSRPPIPSPPPPPISRGRSSSRAASDPEIEAMNELSPIRSSVVTTTPKTNGSINGLPSDDRVREIFEELSANYFALAAEERKRQDNQQMNQIQSILKDWTETITSKTKTLVDESLTAAASANDMDHIHAALSDAQQRRSKILEDIKEAHNLQLQILKAEIAEERRDAAQAQIVFEQTLRTKYDNLVVTLQEKIKTEQEARMQRALEDLERSARLESERAKQSMELQQVAEVALSTKFKSIVGDLRKSWEDEELQRAKFLEERLRGHYSAVLEHMESQLHMALQLQDDADKRWMEDVQERNRQQIESMKAFEEKCTRLYDTRLKEYVNQSEDMINQYEAQLLQVGNTIAMERYQFESRQRRLRLACSKWKVDYQKQLHEKYRDLLDTMERRYGSEIESLLQQIASIQRNIQSTNAEAHGLEQDLHQSGNSIMNPTKLNLMGMPVRRGSSIRAELEASWSELNMSPQDRINILASLLDEAEVTPELMTKFNEISTKLAARLPIMQAISRKQFLEYKMKLALRNGTNNGIDGTSPKSAPQELQNELNDLQNYLSQAIAQYESQYNESFVRSENTEGVGGTLGSRIDGPAKNSAILPSPMSGFPTSMFTTNQKPSNLMTSGGNGNSSNTNNNITNTNNNNNNSNNNVSSPPMMIRNNSGNRPATTTIHRKLATSLPSDSSPSLSKK